MPKFYFKGLFTTRANCTYGGNNHVYMGEIITKPFLFFQTNWSLWQNLVHKVVGNIVS